MIEAQSISYYVYDPMGRILRYGTCPPDQIDIQAEAGQTVAIGEADNSIHYVDLTDTESPVITDKVYVPHTVAGSLISDLPGDALYCVVTGPAADSFTIPATETELEYAPEAPGTYTLTLSGVKYLPTEITIDAP